MTHAKQIAINLVSGVCNTLHANPGMMCPSNVLTPPSAQIRSDRVYKCLTAHYHKVSPRNIFGGFREQAIIVIINEKDNQSVGGVRTSYKP